MRLVQINQFKNLICRISLTFSFIFCLNIYFCTVSNAEERHEDHEALRALLKQSVTALNSGDIEILRSAMLPDALVITAEQHRSSGFDEFKKYFEGLFKGPDSRLTSITFNPVADELTKFVDENVGIASGTSNDIYKFKDGDERTMTSRWTATLIKKAGQWKIASFHFGVNFLENPAIDGVKSFLMKLAIGGALAGLLIGFIGAKICFSKCCKKVGA